ncbi:hypothetical protein LCGC14_2464990 [marine sediment metagenome]|uniref:Uncharacterized protein n=1 Tax=marine sediment metagenome TaxID=412755 RepID=A0A0F9BZU8_9ZZZZ
MSNPNKAQEIADNNEINDNTTDSTEKGKCPKCGGENLNYETILDTGEQISYPFTCDDCGATGDEFYHLKYGGTELS